MDVGPIIRARRKRLGQTLDVLARGSGVSRAMLSDVERGRRSPTLKILTQIAVGLGTSVSELLADPAPDVPHLEPSARHPEILDHGSGVRRVTLASPLLPRGIELVWYVLPPGVEMRRGPDAVWYAPPRRRPSGPFPPNPRGSTEHVTVVSGRAAFAGGGRQAVLRLGDSVSYRLLDEFTFRADGRTSCRLSCFLDTRQTP